MSSMTGKVGLSGAMTLRKVTAADRAKADRKTVRAWKVKNWLRMLRTGEHFVPLVAKLASKLPGVTTCHGRLRLTLIRADGTRLDLGVAGHHLITTAGKNYLASTMDNTAEPELFKYHALGTGTTAAAIGDTALQTECTTALNPDSTRAVGSQAHSGATYTTVGTLTFDGSAAVTEWGLLSATSAGTLLDHQVFAAVNVVNTDSLQITYVLTFS